MRERGFYVMLALASVVGIILTGFLVYKASRLPSVYTPKARESVSTSSSLPSEGTNSSPSSSVTGN